MNTRVRAFFERFRDHERLKPLVRQRHRARPGQFDSERLRLLEDFVLSLNLSQAHQTKLYNLLVFWELTMPGAPGDDGTSVPLRQSFKSPHAFRQAIADCIDRAVIDDGWMSSIITEGGVEVEAFIRNALHQGTRYLRAAKKVRFWIGGDGVAEPTDRREGPLDGDAFRMCEAEVVAGHGRSAFVLAVYIYSDSSVVSWSGAHKLYPVRMRLVNDETDEEQWITIAYVPSVATEKGPGGAERSKQRRIGILQRVLYLTLRDLISASHNGATFVDADGRQLLALPRVLMYICDQPEERAVLCLKPGQCARPCSMCDAPLMSLSEPSALTAMERTILNTLHPQLEAATHLLQGRERQRRLYIEKAVSVNSYMPALAAMGGLTTALFFPYKIIGFDVLHSNGRLQFLGRRCRATLSGSDYVMSAKDKQSTFTGREQRQGVWILPFLVAGIYDRGRRKPVKPAQPPAAEQQPASTVAPPEADGGVPNDEAAEASAVSVEGDDGTSVQEPDPARELLRGLWGSINAGKDAPIAGDEEDVDAARANDGVDKEDMRAAQANTEFDWAAYRRSFPDTPPHAAITAMFAEYALLVGRITRHLSTAVASPVTLAEGEASSKQAQEFVLCYAVPILGSLHTTKVHKLTAHLLEAVRLHGSLMNGDTSSNEQQHKDDKQHYVRTNKSKSGYLRQLVRHANGSRSVLLRNQAAGAGLSVDGATVSGSHDEDRDSEMAGSHTEDNGSDAADDDCSTVELDAADVNTSTVAVDATADAVPPLPSGAAPPSSGAVSAAARAIAARPAGASLRQVTVAKLATSLGLSSLGGLLGLSPADRQRVLTYVHFVTRVPGGFRERQLVRATPMYRGAAWYDCISFHCEEDADDVPERFGQVRALLRQEDKDVAVVAEMARTGVSDGPLTSRGCAHLRWAWLPSGDPGPDAVGGSVRLLCVPVMRWHRVVHVVPDFADLFVRRGVGALPAELGGPAQDVIEQRYLLNAFLPSGGVRVHDADEAGDGT
eukprot:contig_1945_g317